MSPMNTKLMMMIPEGARTEITQNPFEFMFNFLICVLIYTVGNKFMDIFNERKVKDELNDEIAELYHEIDSLEAVNAELRTEVDTKNTKIENLLETVSAMKCDGDARVRMCEEIIRSLNQEIGDMLVVPPCTMMDTNG